METKQLELTLEEAETLASLLLKDESTQIALKARMGEANMAIIDKLHSLFKEEGQKTE